MSYKLILIEKSHIGLIYFHNKLLNIVMEHNVYKLNDIYLGRISTVLPSLDAAFVILNPLSKNGFISFDHPKDKNRAKITKSNRNILVQIIREPVGSKGPSVSYEINMIGKYINLFPIPEFATTIRKNHLELEKEYVRAISNLLVSPRVNKINIKAEIMYANINFLIKEVKILKSRWKKILDKFNRFSKPTLVSKRKSFFNKVLEDYSFISFDFIVVDSYQVAMKLKSTLTKIKRFPIEKNIIIEFHHTHSDLIKYYLIDIVLSEIMKPRVNLSKGGYIIIEKTEALTTIDVNSGSFTNLHSSRQTSLWVNCSAAYEIIRQIRLRNIGGIIIIDFIDSTNQSDQIKLLHYLNKLTKKDYVKCSIIQMSELGVVEMTRTRYGQSVYDAFSKKCKSCNGLGFHTLNLNRSKPTPSHLILSSISRFNRKIHKNS
uniref:Ribonuclease E n=1 Tax=Cryptomonas curvata TaxID=233186 RepID=A0A222AHA3_9CRYP|nr:ribonuclease E [Cryptomonas curvata]ASO75752.1 ribonuclease E [Cryptomonas curvata]